MLSHIIPLYILYCIFYSNKQIYGIIPLMQYQTPQLHFFFFFVHSSDMQVYLDNEEAESENQW